MEESKNFCIVEAVLFLVIAGVLALISVIHPRVTFILATVVFLISGLCCLLYAKKIKKTGNVKKWILNAVGAIVFVVIACLGLYITYPIANLMVVKHAPYEYKSEIKGLKEQYGEILEVFPEELPKDAKSVQWINSPGFMQGAPYFTVSFVASDEYISSLKSQYEDEWTRYSFNTNDNNEKKHLPSMGTVTKKANKNTTDVYEVHSTNDSWAKYTGIVIDEQNKVVGYYFHIWN